MQTTEDEPDYQENRGMKVESSSMHPRFRPPLDRLRIISYVRIIVCGIMFGPLDIFAPGKNRAFEQ